MPLLDFFKGRKRPADNGETSPGGSPMIRYEGGLSDLPQLGFSEDAKPEYAQAREKQYEAFFGPSANVFHEVLRFVPHIDVYTYPPGWEGRNFYTLVTSGMSDLLMTLPGGAPKEYGRAELIWYVSEPDNRYLEIMRWLAHFPHDKKTWLGWGHTMPNGNPPEPFFADSALDTMLFMPSIVSPDDTLQDVLVLDQVPVRFLWLVPVTTPECNLKLKQGVGALYELFDKHQHPVVFSGTRDGYV